MIIRDKKGITPTRIFARNLQQRLIESLRENIKNTPLFEFLNRYSPEVLIVPI